VTIGTHDSRLILLLTAAAVLLGVCVDICNDHLFVYGTLKRGQRNHRLIADQRFLGEATTEPRYRVFDLGPYPGLVIDETNGVAVLGEL
jgi:gamma-glutamylcyclotransferase (GGCT)/AIG2-like uncharacterized protein YtfP